MKKKLRTPIIISSLVIVTGLCAAAWGAFHPTQGASPPPGPDEATHFALAMTYAMQLRMQGDHLMFADDNEPALARYQEAALYDPFTDRDSVVGFRAYLKLRLGRVLDEDEVRALDDAEREVERSASYTAEVLLHDDASKILANLPVTADEHTEATSQ